MDDGRLNIYECLDVPKSSAETVADDERSGVYVLELNSGAIYVGKSDDFQRRIQQHRSNGPRAAAWVKEQGGVRKCLAPRVPRTDDLNDWERKETLVRMMIHGPEKVRGWEFTEPGPLTLEHCATIKTLMFGDGDLCRKCGGSGHFAAQCKNLKCLGSSFLTGCSCIKRIVRENLPIWWHRQQWRSNIRVNLQQSPRKPDYVQTVQKKRGKEEQEEEDMREI
jgi:hypothetical protein